MDIRRWYEAAKRRWSVRKYAAAPDVLAVAELVNIADLLSANGVRIGIYRSDAVFETGLIKQVITGTDCFAAIVEDKNAPPYMAGYLGEAFVLECTRMGLGTCWLGASYKSSVARSIVGISSNEKLRCIISIGVPGERFVRRKRKDLRHLMQLDKADFEADVTDMLQWQKLALECAIIAPSAMNAQPIMLESLTDMVCVSNTGWNFGYGMIDCGIAMLHIEAGAAAANVFGEWSVNGDTMSFLPTDDT